jgi:PAS domain S-box-containing protein
MPEMNATPLTFDSFESLFRAMVMETGDGSLFASSDLTITAANEQACDLFGIVCNDLRGIDVRTLFAEKDRPIIDRATANLQGFNSWIGEVTGLRANGETFPVDLTIKRLPAGDQACIYLVIRDQTENKTLKKLLHEEKSHRREMYITMRNLMKAFEKEKSGIESGIAQKIETLLLPTIERIKKESSAEIRTIYLELIREQLFNLTKGFGHALDGRFLSLTPAELKICAWIKNGYSSKEIAGEMNLAFETVQAHRRNIRKKLSIQGRKVNLFTVLSTKPAFKNAPFCRRAGKDAVAACLDR